MNPISFQVEVLVSVQFVYLSVVLLHLFVKVSEIQLCNFVTGAVILCQDIEWNLFIVSVKGEEADAAACWWRNHKLPLVFALVFDVAGLYLFGMINEPALYIRFPWARNQIFVVIGPRIGEFEAKLFISDEVEADRERRTDEKKDCQFLHDVHSFIINHCIFFE